MKHSIWPWVAGITLLLAVLAIAFRFSGTPVEPASGDAAGAAAAPAQTGPARIERPAAPPPITAGTANDTLPSAIPLPELDDSDEEVFDHLAELLGVEALRPLLVIDAILRNFVVTVDNLPRSHVSERQRPINPIAGSFMVAGPDDALLLNPENYDRYQSLVRLLEATDPRATALLYRRYYPLLQEAYEELGHPDESFHRRLLEVVEHLLEAPQPRGAIALVQPNVLYEYADERLESLSAGHRILIRIGPQNATIVKTWLRALLAQLS